MFLLWKRKEAEDIHKKTKTDADNVDDLVLLANTPNRIHLHSFKNKAEGIDLYVNGNRRKYMF